MFVDMAIGTFIKGTNSTQRDEIQSMMVRFFALHDPLLLSAMVTHFLVVFYQKTFQWRDLLDIKAWTCSYSSQSTKLKAIACFGVIWLCLSSMGVSCLNGALATFLLALPQIYRSHDRLSQQLRVVLGPLTPILAVNNVCREPNFNTLVSACVCFLAFAVLRPDNTAVLGLFHSQFGTTPKATMSTEDGGDADDSQKILQHYLMNSKNRRKSHGVLAGLNCALALSVIISDMGSWTYDKAPVHFDTMRGF